MTHKNISLSRAEREALKSRLDESDLKEKDRKLLKTVLDNLPVKKTDEEARTGKRKLPRNNPDDNKKKKGHRRLSEADYTGATNVPVPLGEYKPGDVCPKCGKGHRHQFEIFCLSLFPVRSLAS